jgi:hypothetical protein
MNLKLPVGSLAEEAGLLSDTKKLLILKLLAILGTCPALVDVAFVLVVVCRGSGVGVCGVGVCGVGLTFVGGVTTGLFG